MMLRSVENIGAASSLANSLTTSLVSTMSMAFLDALGDGGFHLGQRFRRPFVARSADHVY